MAILESEATAISALVPILTEKMREQGLERLYSDIDLPLCRNSIGTGVILSVTSRIAMYENIALTTRGGPGTDTNSLALLLVKATTDYNYGLANAVALLMFIFGILVMLIINRVFRMNDPVY